MLAPPTVTLVACSLVGALTGFVIGGAVQRPPAGVRDGSDRYVLSIVAAASFAFGVFLTWLALTI